MRLTVGLALTLAIMTCGARARDMQSIEHSGELKVGVPGDYAPLAFRNAAGELQGYDVDMARDLGRTLGLKVSFVYTSGPRSPPICRRTSLILRWVGLPRPRRGRKPSPSAIRWWRTEKSP